ncbi:MAG: copper resistance CopC/CopD family protein [Actinomycetota bacterium]
MRRLAVCVTLAALGLILISPRAEPHAAYRSSSPADGARLDAAPEAVTITWTEPPEQSLTTVRVLNTAGEAFQEGEPEVLPDDNRTVRVALADLPEGAYTVTWRTVSTADGHTTAGAFAFGLGVEPGVASVPGGVRDLVTTPPASVLEMVGRWGLLAGLIAVVGAGAVGGALNPGAPGVARLAVAGAGVAAAGGIIFAEAQRRAADTGFSDLLATDVGRALIYRGGLIAICLAAGIAAMRSSRAVTLWAAAGSAALAMLVHVESGHASAAESWTWLIIGSQWIHFLAVGIWIGGLAALLLVIRGLEGDGRGRAVKRFSTMAGFMLAAVVTTGIVRAVTEIPSWSDLFSSAYGRTVLAKITLALGLAGLGAINRYRNVPRSASSVTGLRRISRLELGVASGILIVAAVLASISPPAEGELRRAPPAERIAVTGSDFGTSVRVRLEVLPGFPGSNQFSMRVADYDTGDPVDAERVVLRFAYLDDPSVGQSELELDEASPGTYRAEGPNISLGGNWRVTALVQRGADSVEVPVDLGTRCRARELSEPGLATVHVVDVGDGHTAQGYADPGHMGPNDVHLTFFDAADQEVEIGKAPVVTAAPFGGEDSHHEGVEELKARRLGPGHFVASTHLDAGEHRVEFKASAHGVQMSGCFVVAIEGHG